MDRWWRRIFVISKANGVSNYEIAKELSRTGKVAENILKYQAIEEIKYYFK